jgi:uncharacterized protein YdhG (YjbR/CyaY superfamily)
MDRHPDVDAYVAAVPEKRAGMVTAIREACLEELDGFEEGMAYRMPVYIRGDDEDDAIAFANQKQYVSLYVRTDVMDAHRDQLAGLDLGKVCIRYRRPEQVDMDVVRSILRMTADTRGPIC